MIPYGRQSIDDEDIQAVVDTLTSPFLTQGPAVKEFENKISETVGAKYAVACNSGTSALVMACQALGVTRGDYAWTTANSFAASANCAVLLGAKVDFVDIDRCNWQTHPV